MAYDKVIDSAKLDGAMTATADAIRAKTGGSDTLPWDESTGFASAVEAIESGGDDSTLVGLIEGSLTEFVYKDSVSRVCENFKQIIPNVTLMDVNADELKSNSVGTSVKVLILRNKGIVTLASSSTITSTGLWDSDGDPEYGGDIYVPDKYLGNYKTATNWVSVFNGSVGLHAIEGSEYE